MGWKIFGLFISIFLIWGGLSGEMVLRGTDSSTALVVAGFVFLILDIYSIVTHNKNKPGEEDIDVSEDTPQLTAPATIKVVRDSSMLGAIVPYNVYLNNKLVGKVKNGQTLDVPTSASHNVITVYDNNNIRFKGDFVADLEEGGRAEVHVKAGRFVKQ